MNSKKLITKRKALLDKISTFLSPIEARADSALTAGERATYDADMAEVRALDAQITQAQEFEAAQAAQAGLEARAAAAPAPRALTGAPAIVSGAFSEQRDLDAHSITRALHRASIGEPLEGIELEMHQEGLRELRAAGQTPGAHSVLIPQVVLNRSRVQGMVNREAGVEQRDVTAGTQGSSLIQTDIQTVVGRLMADMPLVGLGMTVAGGLRGNLSFPTFTADDQAAIKTEFAAAAETSPTFTAASMSPRRVPLFLEVTRQFLEQQNLATEAMFRSDMAYQIRKVLETQAINGSGTNEPYGILNTVGVGAVVGGTNGLAPTWDHIVDLESALANADALGGNLGYLTNAKVRGKLKKTAIASNTAATMVWDRQDINAPLNGYRTGVSSLVPSNLTKGTASGVCSAIIFGNFSDCVLGQWGGIEFLVNPYSRDTEDIIRITARTWFDFLVKRPASFAVMKDVLTT